MEGSCSPLNKKVLNRLFGRGNKGKKKVFGVGLVLVKPSRLMQAVRSQALTLLNLALQFFSLICRKALYL